MTRNWRGLWVGLIGGLWAAGAVWAGEPPAAEEWFAGPLRVCAVGDVNLGTAFPSEEFLPPDGGESLLAPVRQWLVGDIVFGNLEGPLVDGGTTEKCKTPTMCYAFRTPTAYVRHLQAAGFTVLGLANNHAMDFGLEGRFSSLTTLERAGIAHSGPLGDVARLRVRGKRIALIAFTTAEHSYNLLDIEVAAGFIRELSRESDLVVVSFHGGSEGIKATRVPDEMEKLGREPRGHLIRFTHAVVDAGADLVIGHGPHVMRGAEIYRRRLIAYSLGNFCTYGRFNLSGPLGRAAILAADLDLGTGELLEAKAFSVMQKGEGGTFPDPEQKALSLLIEGSRLDFPLTAPLFAEDGRMRPYPGDGSGFFTLPEPEERAALRALFDRLHQAGFKLADLQRWFGDRRARLLPEVIERLNAAQEELPYPEYRAVFVNDERRDAARQWLAEHKALLDRLEKKYGVDRHTLAALVTVESFAGRVRGDFPVVNVLTTLIFQDPMRGKNAELQLIALLRALPNDPLSVLGSPAGAVGLVQFLPARIQGYGVDFDRDGVVDLNLWSDAVASAANYLKRSGWKRGGGKANARALRRYNPSDAYVQVIEELAGELGRLHPQAIP